MRASVAFELVVARELERANRRCGAPRALPLAWSRLLEAARGVMHLATSADLTRVSGARFSLAAGALSPGAGCQAPSPDLCGRAPPLPDGFKADAARVFDATYDALLPYIEEL